MRRVAATLVAAAFAVATVGLLAQAKPNFAGKWTQDPAPAAPGGGGGGGGAAGGGGGGRGGGGGGRGGGWGANFEITQDANTLKVSRVQGQNPDPIVETYTLDGKDSSNTAPGRGGQPGTPVVSQASWSGSTIVIKSSRTMNMGGNDMTMKTSRTLSIAADGRLQIDTVSTNPQGGDDVKTTVNYKKGS